MQAPPYTRSQDFAQDERNNVGGRSTLRTDQVDAELDAIATTANALRENLALIQRDDGRLRDQSVDLFNLTPTALAALRVAIRPRGLWTTLTAYVPGDLIDVGGSSFLCAIAHTSTVFLIDYGLGRWQIFVPSSTAATSAFTPTPTVVSTNVQDAISEVDAKLRAVTNPLQSAFFGGL